MGGICKGEKVHTGQTLGAPLFAGKISWAEGLEKPRLYLWGVPVCWLAYSQGREKLVAGLPHFPIWSGHWAGLQTCAVTKHWLSGRQTLGEDLIWLSGDSLGSLGCILGHTSESSVTACMVGPGAAVVDFVGARKMLHHRNAQWVLSLRWRAPG